MDADSFNELVLGRKVRLRLKRRHKDTHTQAEATAQQRYSTQHTAHSTQHTAYSSNTETHTVDSDRARAGGVYRGCIVSSVPRDS